MICCDRDLGQNRDACFIGGLLFCEQSDIISIQFYTDLYQVCTKSLEAWRDIQMLDVVAKAIRVMNNETSLKSLIDLGNYDGNRQ